MCCCSAHSEISLPMFQFSSDISAEQMLRDSGWTLGFPPTTAACPARSWILFCSPSTSLLSYDIVCSLRKQQLIYIRAACRSTTCNAAWCSSTDKQMWVRVVDTGKTLDHDGIPCLRACTIEAGEKYSIFNFRLLVCRISIDYLKWRRGYPKTRL